VHYRASGVRRATPDYLYRVRLGLLRGVECCAQCVPHVWRLRTDHRPIIIITIDSRWIPPYANLCWLQLAVLRNGRRTRCSVGRYRNNMSCTVSLNSSSDPGCARVNQTATRHWISQDFDFLISLRYFLKYQRRTTLSICHYINMIDRPLFTIVSPLCKHTHTHARTHTHIHTHTHTHTLHLISGDTGRYYQSANPSCICTVCY